MNAEITLKDAQELDGHDRLSSFADRFHIPQDHTGRKACYLNGNSLGLQPRHAAEYVNAELDDWATLGVEGHFKARKAWLPYHEFLTEGLMSLTGSNSDEVVAMNSLTVNLHLMLTTFYRPTSKRFKILMGYSPFPSDRYAVESQIRLHGLKPEEALVMLAPPAGETIVRDDDIAHTIKKHGDSIALVLLEGVNYYTGQAINFSKVINLGHEVGAYVGFDLAHTIGNIPLKLHDWNLDFAVWCSYKYLNGGPGCVAGCFVHRKHGQNKSLPRLAGWWGHNKDTRFQMGPDFDPITGAEGWQISNPPILALAALRASLDLFQEAGITALREKSIKLTSFLERLLLARAADRIEIITPREPERRGCQLSLRLSGGKETFQRLGERGIISDWREPDVIRIAPVPLYNSYQDVYRFVEALTEI